MKSRLTTITLVIMLSISGATKSNRSILRTAIPPVHNLFIITLDGFRWQEVFYGADSLLINSDEYTPDGKTIKMLYWAGTAGERRKKLMPFFWSIIGEDGQIYGNRNLKNKVNTANAYAISYPGYNELFTGGTDPGISSNQKTANPNINVLEYLNTRPGFTGEVVVFTSWDAFPYILNEKRSDLIINSGYNSSNETGPSRLKKLQDYINDKTETRLDQLTFLTAKEYIQQNNPRVVYIGLGETDESAHQGRYDLYLDHANQADKMIGELWHWVQTTPGYRDNTTFIITTDHGRGINKNKWTSHGKFIRGSSQTWLALIGPGINPSGEVKQPEQLYQQQVAATIAELLGEEFMAVNK